MPTVTRLSRESTARNKGDKRARTIALDIYIPVTRTNSNPQSFLREQQALHPPLPKQTTKPMPREESQPRAKQTHQNKTSKYGRFPSRSRGRLSRSGSAGEPSCPQTLAGIAGQGRGGEGAPWPKGDWRSSSRKEEKTTERTRDKQGLVSSKKLSRFALSTCKT